MSRRMPAADPGTGCARLPASRFSAQLPRSKGRHPDGDKYPNRVFGLADPHQRSRDDSRGDESRDCRVHQVLSRFLEHSLRDP